MKESNTANRLKQLMSVQNLKQVDILNACAPFCKKYGVKMNKSDISQYVSGKAEPNQDKLFILGSALNVSEAWLMGYDAPIERNVFDDPTLNRFDKELDDAINIIESYGFFVSYSDDKYGNIIIVKNKNNDIIFNDYDWVLVNRYESTYKKHNFVNAVFLLGLDIDSDAFSKLYSIPKPGNAGYAFSDIDNRLSDIVYKFQELNEDGKNKAYEYITDLSEQSKYKRIIYSTVTKAAHNDYENEPGEVEKMQNDLANLKRPE